MLKFLAAFSVALCLSGCAVFSSETPGRYWCNEPFLRVDSKQFGLDELNAARHGYMYVTAAALALQHDSEEDKNHWIEVPERISIIQPDPILGETGFEARAFLLKDRSDPRAIEALIVAYTGSQTTDFWKDWILTNLFGSQSQYKQARELFKTLAAKYPNARKKVATGFSLGGALAAHVGLHPETSSEVTEVWAFNPSGRVFDERNNEEKIKSLNERDTRFWLVANYAEIVRYTRSTIASIIPGMDWIPAPGGQFVNRVQLIKTNGVQGHFRYILFRDLLFAAEQDARKQGFPVDQNEPLGILRGTRFSSCKAS